MGYKSVLTVATNPSGLQQSLEPAIAVARREAAHLDVLCLGIDPTQTGYYYAGANAMILQQSLSRAREEGEAVERAVAKRMQREDVPWGSDTAVAQISGVAALVADWARYADLVVLPRPYGEGKGVEDEAILEAALFEGNAPVLMVPEGGLEAGYGHRIVVAWNESPEALSAVRRAMPLLARATLVDIVVVDPPQRGPERSDPGGRLSQMIARHGCRAEVSVLAKTMPRVSDVIRRHVMDRAGDMVVMGAYGHSRFREAILGGATRNMLEGCEVPVFLAR